MALYCLSKYKERKSRDDIYTKDQLGEPKIKEVMTEIKELPVKFKNNVSKATSNFASDVKEEQNLNLPTTASSNVVSDAKDGKKLDSPMTVGTICNNIQGRGQCQVQECLRECTYELKNRKEASHCRATCEKHVRPQQCCCSFYKLLPPTLANNIVRIAAVGDDGFLGR